MAKRSIKSAAEIAHDRMDDNVRQDVDTMLGVSNEDLDANGDRFPVVGIVASAGGLDAFKSFFAAMPNDSGMAFVVVPHLDAKHKSLMVELLARQTKMPIVEVVDGMVIRANSVYVIPPNHFLSISEGQLRLSSLPSPLGAQTAIDFFLRSLGRDREELAIGIVLSGTGTHGVQGLREIKRCGGMAMAQSPETCGFDQMPRSAIETGLVDFVLAPADMPTKLLEYVKQPYIKQTRPVNDVSASVSEKLKTILELTRSRTKYDFRSYRANMILRRIERRMGLVQLENLGKYLELLNDHPEEIDALCHDFLIGVTSFFREPEAFAFLERELFPVLVAKHTDDRPFRVWIPSCATGEEAYSIAMLLFEAFKAANKPFDVQIFASDINQQSVDIARRGVYSSVITCDVTVERLKNFFVTSDEASFRVSKPLRESIIFSKQNLLSDSPFSKLDLICCRNLMIYLKPEIQQKLLALFHYSLVENGHLFLGSAETIGRASNLFEAVSKKWRIYRRVGVGKQAPISLPIEKWENPSKVKSGEHHLNLPKKAYKELAERNLLEYSPAAVLINRRLEVLYVCGSMGDYLEFPRGELSKDLLAMARPGLRTRLSAICHSALSQGAERSDGNAQVKRHGRYFPCTIIARPILGSGGSDTLVLVVFREHVIDQLSQPAKVPDVGSNMGNTPSPDSPTLVQLLEFELKSTREELQNTIEEMESANEELQSSNEELGSAKEELQSLNEELSTVNCQLLEKVGELDKSNGEILNLMASTEIATLYLDNQLRIKRFTHPTVKLFHLLPSDEGRSIRDFASQIGSDKLFEDCLVVLDSHDSVEREIFTDDNRCFLRRILPFRITDQTVEGVVVTFIDLTARNRAAAEQHERDACFREIFNHAATGIAIAGLNGVFEKCNPAFCRLLGYSEAELISLDFLSLVHPDDRARNTEAFDILLNGKVSSFDIDNRYLHKNGSVVSVRKFVSILPDGKGKPSSFLTLVTDVSLQLKALEDLRQSEERIRTILITASDAIITINNRGLIDSVNRATEQIFGYESSELIGNNVSMLMPQPFSREHDGYIQRFVRTGEARVIGSGREVICRRKNGSTFPADLAISKVDHLGLFTGILRDITSRKEMQKHILEIAAMEQRRIGLELHDGTQQELTGLSLYASTVMECIGAAKPTANGAKAWQLDAASYVRLRDTAALLAKRIVETNENVRDLAHGIMPVQIDAEGLRSALVELANTVNSNERIDCKFECHGENSALSTSVATNLYRIAQEAVSNAIRHSSADEIEISLTLSEERSSLKVSDNGIGLKAEENVNLEPNAKGMGMRTMEYRANIIGGRVQFLNGPKGGTVMSCEILKGGHV
jgi:two-component system, chemotaxis family, CheB/CheR fusion protein